MKSLLSWFVLIVSIAILISSCAKSDDSKTASTDNTTSSSDDSSDNSSSSSDSTAPTVTSVSTTADNQSAVSITDNITVTFSEAMDTTYVTTSTSDTNCAGTIRVSSDNFSTCVKMSSEPAGSNSNQTFTLDPSDNLTGGTTYLTRVTTGVKDTAGNAMSSQYETSSGFTTSSSSSSSSCSGVFVAVAHRGDFPLGAILRSCDNGESFDNATSPSDQQYSRMGVAFGNNTFVAVGGYSDMDLMRNVIEIARSVDNGESFSAVTSPNIVSHETFNEVAFGNDTFVAVGDKRQIMRSTDNGSSFDNATSPTANDLYGVTFGNNTFVAVGASGNILRSTDNGSSWDNVTSPTGNHLSGITFGNDTFVAVGGSNDSTGTIVRSTDNGSSFSTVTSSFAQNLTGVTFGD